MRGAEPAAQRLLHARRQMQQRAVLVRRRDQGDAERQAVAWNPAGTAVAARSSRFMKLV
jgi:hypothetical protein